MSLPNEPFMPPQTAVRAPLAMRPATPNSGIGSVLHAWLCSLSAYQCHDLVTMCHTSYKCAWGHPSSIRVEADGARMGVMPRGRHYTEREHSHSPHTSPPCAQLQVRMGGNPSSIRLSSVNPHTKGTMDCIGELAPFVAPYASVPQYLVEVCGVWLCSFSV